MSTAPPRADLDDSPYYTEVMWREVRRANPRIVVEIGSYGGRWAEGALAAAPEARVFCVDPWDWGVTGPPFKSSPPADEVFAEWILRMERAGALWTRAFPLVGTSEFWARRFPHEIDLLYVDGDHSYHAVRRDLIDWTPKVRLGGTIIGHDYVRDSVRLAAEAVFGRGALTPLFTGPKGNASFVLVK